MADQVEELRPLSDSTVRTYGDRRCEMPLRIPGRARAVCASVPGNFPSPRPHLESHSGNESFPA